MQRPLRLKRELEKMENNPPAGISCYMEDSNSYLLQADVVGPEASPYENGLFKIEIQVPEKYPFEPPLMKFLTKVYHPNIDLEGRICLDLLKMPPNGNWRPTIGIEGLLIAVQMLLGNPNLEDPLMAEIADECKTCKEEFERKAKEYTAKFAVQKLSA